jgi:glycosyltransferase involved in cell wall biosynthesis
MPLALIVTPKYLPFLGGMERECALLSDELRRRGHEVVIVTEQLGLGTPLLEEADGVRVHRVPSSPQRTLRVQLSVALRMALLVLRYRRASLAIVRTTTLPAVLVGLLKRLRLIRFPTLVTAETGGVADDVVALAERPLFAVSRALVSSHDRLNGICQANVDHLHEYGFPAGRITFIPNGIDTSAWDASAPPERVRRFLFLGRLDPEKGLFELLEAFERVRAEHPDVTLTIAGEGPALDELRERAGDGVSFAGRIPYEQLGELFDRHDCMVLPSYSEGMPLSVLEAAAHRRVLIVTDVGDMRMLFGDSVRIIQPRDVSALTAAMRAAGAEGPPSADYGAVIERVSIQRVTDEILAALGVSSSSRSDS